MTADITRRDFLKGLSSAAAVALLCDTAGALTANNTDTFEMLVLGDSLVWGQGLNEDQKFYALTKAWLRDEVFRGSRDIRLNIKAHSGATINLSIAEAKALLEAPSDLADDIHPEINVSFPTIKAQLNAAKADYDDPHKVGLILLSGGVPEVGVSNILNPFRSDASLRSDIEQYCFREMSGLLQTTAEAFPAAIIAVVGYYPIITRHTPVKRIVNDILELYNWPGWTKPLMINALNRVLWRRYRRKMIRRSRIWVDDSSVAFSKAVRAVNDQTGRGQAVFVQLPFGEKNGYGAQETYLWGVGKKGLAADPMGKTRKSECRPTLDELRRETELGYRTRVCELASIGHPNAVGSAAIAEAIRKILTPSLTKTVSNH